MIINFPSSSFHLPFIFNPQILKLHNRRKITNGYSKIAAFTLVEQLVYMGLMVIFLTVLLGIFSTSLNAKLSTESTSGVNADSRYILSKLTYDINNASGITAPTLGNTGSTLSFVLSGVNVSYSLSNGNLIRTSGGVGMAVNGTDTQIESLNFTNIGNAGGKPTIQVSYSVRSKIILQGGNTYVQAINTTVGTR